VFADGLNIPTGLAVGYGGVWVLNAPDLLVLVDTDGDGRADKSEVVVTGFGRADAHELPRPFTTNTIIISLGSGLVRIPTVEMKLPSAINALPELGKRRKP
jgi:hypothetical protein